MSTPTRHDASKVAMGSVGSSDRVVTNFDADPASFPAGLAVKNNAGALSLSTGELIGVSIGRSQSDHKKTAICRVGNRVPLQLTDEGVAASLEEGDLTFTAKEKGVIGEEISIELVDGGTAGAEVVTVTDKKISVSMDDGVSTATQIKAAIDGKAEALALITTTISGTASAAQDAFAEENLDGGVDSYGYVVVGAAVQLGSTSGKAVSSGDATGAKYVDGVKTGVKADGTTVAVAIIDMGGGL